MFGGGISAVSRRAFPHLVDNYRRRYQDRAFLPPSYGKRISQLIARSARNIASSALTHAEQNLATNGWCRPLTSSWNCSNDNDNDGSIQGDVDLDAAKVLV